MRLEILKADNIDNIDNQKTKKKDFTNIYKSVKKGYYYKELELDTFKFYYATQPNDILTVANKYYRNVNYTLPKNHDCKNFNKDIKKTFKRLFAFITNGNKDALRTMRDPGPGIEPTRPCDMQSALTTAPPCQIVRQRMVSKA